MIINYSVFVYMIVVKSMFSSHTKFLVCLRYVKGMVVHTLNIPRTYLEHTMHIPTLGI